MVASESSASEAKTVARSAAKAWWQSSPEPVHEMYCSALGEFLASRTQPGWVVVYRAMPGEVNLEPLLSRPESGPFATTRTPDRGDGYALTVHPVDAPVERHPYGYLQPVADAPLVPDHEIGVVLVPALAFDRAGNRLGRGMGYYDRFLARLQNHGCVFVGITGGHVVEELPTGRFDIPMSHLAVGHRVVSVPLDPRVVIAERR